jgi:hypothetical protein
MKAARDFHNRTIKSGLILKACESSGHNGGASIIDLGVGRLGDLNKYLAVKATRILGIDKSSSNLTDPDFAHGGAHTRILSAQDPKKQRTAAAGAAAPTLDPAKTKIVCIAADASKDLTSVAYLTSLARKDDVEVAQILWGVGKYASNASDAITPPSLRPYHNFARRPFDAAVCMFAIHYMFDREESLRQFARNVKAHLRGDGYFVGCCFDGDAVDNLLSAEAPELGDAVSGTAAGDQVAWRITRKYAKGAPKEAFGRSIDVYVANIGKEFPEYLVSFPRLTKILSDEADLHLVESRMFGETLDSVSFSSSTSMMRIRDEARPLVEALQRPENAHQKKYSFLNRWFVFQHKSVKS